MRRIFRLPAALFLLVAAPAAAHAGIPIPCTGESIVKVLDIPVLAQVEVDAGGHKIEKRFDLGYKFSGCFGGEWIAHTGSDREYVAVDDARLQMMLRAAGRTTLPPVPSFWKSRQAPPVYIWLAIFGFAAVSVTLKKSKDSDAAPAADRVQGGMGDAGSGGGWAAATALLEAGVREQQASSATAPAPRAPGPRTRVVSPRASAATRAPSFGRRQ